MHPTPIPDKGKVLTGLTAFWLDRTGRHLPQPPDLVHGRARASTRGRAMLVEKLEMVPVECVVRGYIWGSGFKGYQAKGAVCGIGCPRG